MMIDSIQPPSCSSIMTLLDSITRVVLLYYYTTKFCITTSALHLEAPTIISRQTFLQASAVTTLSLPWFSSSTQLSTPSTTVIPLTFLSLGGCLAIKIAFNDKSNDRRLFAYSAIVDTGSPFLTAPPLMQRYSQDASRRYPPTQEQYGEAIGGMNWRSVSNLEVLTQDYEYPLMAGRMILGLPDTNVVDDTGGIFCGLIWQDDERPTVLKQWGYTSFILDYKEKLLTLSRQSTIDANNDPNAMDLFDFSPYGDNIHHYGVLCPSFTLSLSPTSPDKRKTVPISSLKRPVVAVIDSGLTGCVFSDSLRDELVSGNKVGSLDEISGLQVMLPQQSGQSLVLSSNPAYWFLSSFKLPWFRDDEDHPHVIALGATFLAPNSRISIDPLANKARIEI